MNCLACGKETEVLQTFGGKDTITRIRGHRDYMSCGYRGRTIERYHAFEAEGMVSAAISLMPEMASILCHLTKVHESLCRHLGLTPLSSVLDLLESEEKE